MRPIKQMRTLYFIGVPIVATFSLLIPQSLGARILTFFLILLFGGIGVGFTYLIEFIGKKSRRLLGETKKINESC
ncbi:hypothetical protein [Bacillus pseudomycoides]|uniref:hypothetical protein n=1 Tax=Bacillus pseudomycoides TaxID=64104 RepID=UPI001FB45B9F|nr:hypothetical protein [Bacillus pseudomycoides]